MKTALALCLILLNPAWIRAEWIISEVERLAAPSPLEFSKRMASQNGLEVEIHAVSFSPKTHTLVVMDNPAGALTLATASEKRGVFAAVNGGYFHPDRTPLGLVIWQGKTIHPLQRAKLLSGMVVAGRSRVSLLRVAEYKASPSISDALQAGPFLVDGGKPVAGLNADRLAARTVVFIDDKGRCGILVCKYASLAETGAILATHGVAGPGRIVRALNLDGGSSTGLWVKGEPPFYLREGKGVRNYLGIVAK